MSFFPPTKEMRSKRNKSRIHAPAHHTSQQFTRIPTGYEPGVAHCSGSYQSLYNSLVDITLIICGVFSAPQSSCLRSSRKLPSSFLPQTSLRSLFVTSQYSTLCCIMTTEERNTQTTLIFKLKGASNYRPWSIVMKLLLRSKDWWKIVNGEEEEPEPPTKSSSSDPSTTIYHTGQGD